MASTIVLNQDSPSVIHLCKRDKRLAKVISQVGEISYSPHEDAYAFLIREIIEQMLSIKVGRKIYDRLLALCDGKITPTAINKLSDEQIKSTGTSTAKVDYIRSVTNAVMENRLDFSSLSEIKDQEIIKKLVSLRGVGYWTAKMYLIFVLDRPDVLPYEDAAFLQSYSWLYKTTDKTPTSIQKKCSKWHPYSSTAVRYLYQALDMGLTKEEFHLHK